MPLLFEPGEGWSYGTSFEAVGVLVGRLNGNIGLEQYMRQNILGPLGLESSTFMPEDIPALRGRQVQLVAPSSDGNLVHTQHGTRKNQTVPQGGGGLYATVLDHHAVLSDLVSEDPKLLRRETIELLFSLQLASGTPVMTQFEANRPLLNSLLASLIGDLKLNHYLGGVLVMEDSPTL